MTIKFKKHKANIRVIMKDGPCTIISGFIILATPVNKEQAFQIAKILFPDENVIDVELENIGENT